MSCPTKFQLAGLHLHTEYSVLDGASSIDEYIEWCKQNGSPGLAVTDHGYAIGGLELYTKAKKAGLTGIPGIEFYVAPDSDYKFAGKAYDYYHVTAWAVSEVGYRNLLKLTSTSFLDDQILTTKAIKSDHKNHNIEGFHNRVVKPFGQVKPRITFDELLENHEGLVLGSGCLIGAVNKALLAGENLGAERNLLRLLEVYKGRLFVELMPHHCSHDYSREKKGFVSNECTDFAPDGDLQKACNIKNIEIARKFNLPLLLTVDSHFVSKDQKPLQDMLLQNGDPSGWHFYESYYMMTTEDAWQHWKEVYGEDKEQRLIFTEAVENNHQIVDMAKGLKINDPYRLPEISIPRDIIDISTDERDALKIMIMNSIEKHGRMKWDNPDWTARLEKEMSVICDNGEQDFAAYFIFLDQWQEWTRKNSILSAPGRGSGGGSLLCYLMKITHLDPFKYKLPFERFLSPGRVKRKKWPDIDWDMGDRDVLVAKLFEVYGDKMAQCSTHGKLAPKSAIKDIHRIFAIRPLEEKLKKGSSTYEQDPDEQNKIVAELEFIKKEVQDVANTIDAVPTGVDSYDFLFGYEDKGSGEYHEGHLYSNTVLQEFFLKHKNNDTGKDMQNLVGKMLGIPRSVGRHASAFFLSNDAIYKSVPTCTISGVTCTQYTAAGDNYAEKAGLIKFDFLRVNTLADISNCIRLVQRNKGYKINKETIKLNNQEFRIFQGDVAVESVPSPYKEGEFLDVYNLPEDPDVFKDISKGKNASLFQISTPLLGGLCKEVLPDSIEDIAAITALGRPGPMKATIEDGKTTFVAAYIKRKHGVMPITYAHPDMEPILKDTYGVIVYQEQLQQMFVDLAGYSLEEGDLMREMIGKKKKQDMEKILPELKKRLQDRGWNVEQIEMFLGACMAAASYSFNRAHSASYGYVAYISSFLRFHYPKEWWTSVLQNCKIDEIRENGYSRAIDDILVMPHINGPTVEFEDRADGKVHSPLWIIKGVADAACVAINKAIVSGGDFVSIQDFFERVDKRAVNEGIVKKLLYAGAFDLIETNKDINEKFKEYMYLKRVNKLKSADGKTGQDLRDLVAKFISDKGLDPEVEQGISEFYISGIELEIKKNALLPIYSNNIHDTFRDQLKKYIHYDSNEQDPFDTVAIPHSKPIYSVRQTKLIKPLLQEFQGDHRRIYAWCGLLEESEDFDYTDKKTKEKVIATKMKIMNDGDYVECIIWPNQKEFFKTNNKKEPSGKKILMCFGPIKEGKNGIYTLSVNDYMEI